MLSVTNKHLKLSLILVNVAILSVIMMNVMVTKWLHLCQPDLKLKAWHRQLLGSLPLHIIVLPAPCLAEHAIPSFFSAQSQVVFRFKL